MPSHVLQWFYMVAATSSIRPKDARFSSFLLFFWSRVSSLSFLWGYLPMGPTVGKSRTAATNSPTYTVAMFPHFGWLNLSLWIFPAQRKPCISSPMVPKRGCRKCCWDPASAEDLRWCLPSVAEWAEQGWGHPWLSGPQQSVFFQLPIRWCRKKALGGEKPTNSSPNPFIGRDFHRGHLLTGDIIAFVLSGIWWVAWAGLSVLTAVKEQCFFLWWDDQLQSGSGSTSKIAAAVEMWFHGCRNHETVHFGVLEFGATLCNWCFNNLADLAHVFSHIMPSSKLLKAVLKS